MLNAEDLISKAQQLYVSYYGRPADPGGLYYWVEQFEQSNNLDQALAAFGSSAEFLITHANASPQQLINALYQQMFNRDADPQGMDFYTTLLASGQATLASIALDIALGAQRATDPTDAQTLANKISVANTFTAAVESAGANYRSIHIPETQLLLAGVDDRESTLIVGNVRAGELSAEIIDRDTPDPAIRYILTAGADLIESGDGNDTFEATSATLTAPDFIADKTNTDDDLLTVVQTEAASAATISNIERINVLVDVFNGEEAPFNASGITGARITINSEKLGFNGQAALSGAGANAIIAGNAVSQLEVKGLTTGSVDAGGALGLTIEGSTANTSLVTVNGDIDLTVSGTQAVRLQTTEAAEIRYDSPSAFATTLEGSQDLTLIMQAEDINPAHSITDNSVNAISTVRTDASAFNASKFQVDQIQLVGSNSVSASISNSARLLTSQDMSTLLISPALSGSSAVTVSTAHSIGLLNLTAANLTSTLEVSGTNTIDDLRVGSNPVTLTGSGSLTIGSTDAGEIHAGALAANLSLLATTNNTLTLTTGPGGADYSVPTGSTTVYKGGTGRDSVNASALNSGSLNADLGAGNDTVRLPISSVAEITLTGGIGTDTLTIENKLNTASFKAFTFTGFETIQLPNPTINSADALEASFKGSELSGQALTFEAIEPIDVTTINVSADTSSTDLSRLTLVDIDEFIITGQTSAETLYGSSGSDRIVPRRRRRPARWRRGQRHVLVHRRGLNG